jgi:hypothetical protein
MRAQYTAAALLLCTAHLGCQDLSAPADPPEVDEAFFRCHVQPVLTKNCAAFACHGDARRPLRLFARNRLRLGGTEATRNAPLSAEERSYNFAAARAFVDGHEPEESLLLMKPLEASKGGYFHRGAEDYGKGNVFRDAQDPEYRAIVDWIGGAREEASCVEPGSDS